MAGTTKSWHITVIEKTKTVFYKKVFDTKEANQLFKDKKAEYPPPQYIVMKEQY